MGIAVPATAMVPWLLTGATGMNFLKMPRFVFDSPGIELSIENPAAVGESTPPAPAAAPTCCLSNKPKKNSLFLNDRAAEVASETSAVEPRFVRAGNTGIFLERIQSVERFV